MSRKHTTVTKRAEVPKRGSTPHKPVKAKPAKKAADYMARVFQRLGPSVGARVHVEPRFGFVARVEFPGERISYTRYWKLDLNPIAAGDLARDKDFAAYFLARAGYPVPEGRAFTAVREAYEYARSLGWPVIVKPNSSSLGHGVSQVHSRKEFYEAARFVLKTERVLLVQRVVAGDDYRILVLDDRVLSAYRRIPLTVVGTGRATIRALLTRKRRELAKERSGAPIDLEDFRIPVHLASQGLDLQSVPAKGERVVLRANANLSDGGEAEDVTDRLHPEFVALAVGVTRAMGLRLCGVDLLVRGPIVEPPRDYTVLEVNSVPGVTNYAATPGIQRRVVDDIYRAMLLALKHH